MLFLVFYAQLGPSALEQLLGGGPPEGSGVGRSIPHANLKEDSTEDPTQRRERKGHHHGPPSHTTSRDSDWQGCWRVPGALPNTEPISPEPCVTADIPQSKVAATTFYELGRSLIDLLMGLFRGVVFRHSGGARKQPIKQPIEMPTSTMALMGRFPSLMGRFPTLMGRFPISS